MAILFEVLAEGDVIDSQALNQPFVMRAFGYADIDSVFGLAQSVFALTGGGLMEDEEGEIVISVPGTGSATFGFGTGGAFFDVDFGSASGEFFLTQALGQEGDTARNTFALGAGGFDYALMTAYGFFVEQPAVVTSYGGTIFETLESDLSVGTQINHQLAYVVSSILRVADAASPLARFAVTVQSSLVYRDFVTIVLSRELNDNLILTDLNTSQLRIIGLLVDQLILADETVGRYDALVTVISALLLADRAVVGLDGTLNEDLILNDTLDRDVRIIAEMVSNIELDDELEPILYLFATLEDTFSLADETTVTAALIAELLDTVSFGARARVGSEVFIGYSMNTRLAAVSEYQNYPFNSLAMVGGRRYGAGAAGVYRLEGDDDDGDPIAAHVRTGYLNFEALTHVINAWIGYTSDGQLILKAITGDGGTRKENWYRMKARPGGGPVETRFDLAKGLLGTYWAFEIENLDGADFELDIVKIWPLRTQRRYSGR